MQNFGKAMKRLYREPRIELFYNIEYGKVKKEGGLMYWEKLPKNYLQN